MFMVCNFTDGGKNHPLFGKKMSEETKQKIYSKIQTETEQENSKSE